MPFLEDLRRHIYRGVIIFAAIFVTGFFSASFLLKKVLDLVNFKEVVIATSSPFQFADVAIDVGFFLATIVLIPYFVYSFYSFILPALTKSERKKMFKSIPISIGLFVIGFLYGFFILYYALDLMAQINTNLGIKNIWDISEFLSQMFLTATLLGLVFEFPLLLTLLIKFNLIKTDLLKNKRRLVYFLIFCLVSLLPPTDGASLIAMSLPLVLLYEVTILLNNHKTKPCLD